MSVLEQGPMLIGAEGEPFDSPDYLYELKLDGERCIAILHEDRTELRNKRSVLTLPKFPELAGIHHQVSVPCILDGELMVQRNGAPDFWAVQRRSLLSDSFKIRLAARQTPASFVAFDLLEKNGVDVTKRPLTERKELLAGVIRQESERFAISRYIQKQGTALYGLAKERNLEGVVAKRRVSLYYPGKRTRDWIKFKYLKDDDFVVCGYIRKSASIASVVIGAYEDGRLRYMGHVTLGVSREVLDRLMESERQAEPPVLVPASGNEGAVWLRPELVCTVRYMEKTSTGSLRQPVFKGLRNDKTVMELAEDSK